MNNVTVYVEGQTEQRLLKNYLKVPCQIKVINLWKTKEGAIVRGLRREHKVIVVFDTDTLYTSERELEQFKTNLRFLKKHTRLKGIMQQTNNFEDELIHACQCNKKQDLFDMFDVQHTGDFKSRFLDCRNFPKAFQRDLIAERLWSRPLHECLQEFEQYHLDGKIFIQNYTNHL